MIGELPARWLGSSKLLDGSGRVLGVGGDAAFTGSSGSRLRGDRSQDRNNCASGRSGEAQDSVSGTWARDCLVVVCCCRRTGLAWVLLVQAGKTEVVKSGDPLSGRQARAKTNHRLFQGSGHQQSGLFQAASWGLLFAVR